MYRAAFVPALPALLLAMFSLESRPRPLPQEPAADVLFDGRLAAAGARSIVAERPDRRAGSPGDLAQADAVAGKLEDFGFAVGRDDFSHDDRELMNVVGTRPAQSRRQVVVVAARDAAGVPDAPGSAADTAALLELARVFDGRSTRKTLVLASVDGSTLGEVGGERLLGELPAPDLVDGVVVISNLGARARRGPMLQAWSNSTRRAGLGLSRTVADSIRGELEQPAGASGVLGQLARLAFPVGIGAQGGLLEHGYDAVRISGSGELPPKGPGGADTIDEERLSALGSAALRTVTALDQGDTPRRGPESYVTVASQVMPSWVLSLVAGTLLLPALVAAVDAFARARRRRLDALRWMRWLGAWTAPFLAALAAAELLALFGATPTPPPAPVPPELLPLDGPAQAVLAGVLAAMLLAGFTARFLAARPDAGLRSPEGVGPAVALALVGAPAALLVWLVNPYAGLVVVPAAHLWMIVLLSGGALRRRVRGVLLGLGAAPVLLVALYHLFALQLDPLEAVWYLTLLVTGHSVGTVTVLLGCVLLGVGCATVELVWRTPVLPETPPPPPGPALYGPGSHAGPGSLGGTESALRR